MPDSIQEQIERSQVVTECVGVRANLAGLFASRGIKAVDKSCDLDAVAIKERRGEKKLVREHAGVVAELYRVFGDRLAVAFGNEKREAAPPRRAQSAGWTLAPFPSAKQRIIASRAGRLV